MDVAHSIQFTLFIRTVSSVVCAELHGRGAIPLLLPFLLVSTHGLLIYKHTVHMILARMGAHPGGTSVLTIRRCSKTIW